MVYVRLIVARCDWKNSSPLFTLFFANGFIQLVETNHRVEEKKEEISGGSEPYSCVYAILSTHKPSSVGWPNRLKSPNTTHSL